jgi:hypothetical protein
MWRSWCIALSFLILALDGDELSTSRFCHFLAWGIVPGTHWLGDWVDLKAGMDAMKKRSYFCRESNISVPARSPSLYQLSYQHVINWSTISALAWLDWGKLQNPSIMIASVQAEVQTEYLLNKSQNRLLLEPTFLWSGIIGSRMIMKLGPHSVINCAIDDLFVFQD